MIAINDGGAAPLRVEDGRFERPTSSFPPSPHRAVAPLRQAIFRTRQWLLAAQHVEGYWLGELEGDSILQSETILLLAYFGRLESKLARQAAARLLESQRSEGGWSLYPGGPVDVSASVKAYFALKLTGHEPQCEPMQRARCAILECGGAENVNSFTRFYLALLGQIPYASCPEVPPEFILLPRWFPLNLGSVSAWSRTMFVPLSV
jgi:squalene-hopene/tetraprenyl-beta-curcumene cyclase